MVATRGIANVSHVSCHLACALQVIIHCIEPLRDALIEIASSNITVSDGFVLQLASFCETYHCNDDDDDAPVDPSQLYKVMKDKTSIDPNNLGDAVTALRRILQALRTSAPLKGLCNSILVGVVRHDICGSRGNQKRTKSQDRNMACPFPLQSASSVEEALENTTTSPISGGYDWEQQQASSYVEETTDKEEHLGGDEWTTHKTVRFVSAPQHLMLHVQRFSYQEPSIPLHEIMNVPSTINLVKYLCNNDDDDDQHDDYHLTGAIMYVVDSDDDDEEEGGHYVSVVREDQDRWCLLDDNNVTSLEASLDEVLNFLSGRPSTVQPKEGRQCITMLLSYRQLLGDDQQLLQQFREELEANQIIWDESLIRKRLKVRWAKGKWYTGVVTAYKDGKHTVKYADGDVKEYILKKKTLEWLE